MDEGTALVERFRAAMRDGARLDVLRLFFNPTHKWGVQVYERGKTKGGNDKWVKIPTLLLPSEGETIADVLKMLGDMAEEAE